jgi:hypothetical protein
MASKDNTTLFILLSLLLLGGGGYAVYTMTRGLRNNNPGNIKDDGTAWEGLDSPRNDGTFLRFISADYGIRAIGRILSNYVAVDGLAPTVDTLIRRWSATDQDAYVQHVAADLGVDANATLDLTSSLPALVASITSMENGLNPYSAATITAGLNLA